MYTEQFKEGMIKKMLMPGGMSSAELARQEGIAPSTLSGWKKKHGRVTGVSNNQRKRRPQDWAPGEKLQALHDTAKLGEQELGEYLRREGLHSAQLGQWTKDFLDGMKSLTPSGRRRRFVSEEKKRIKELERELRRKEKALAETAALLILKKKADLIFGVVEDEEQS